MPQQLVNTIENNFTGGLKTEYTGLNFPENAATDSDNVTFSLIGETERRGGIDFESGHVNYSTDLTNKAISTYKWTNVAGTGEIQIFVVQMGNSLHFYKTSDATPASPMSAHKLSSIIFPSSFAVSGIISDTECQFADGNGYLFVFHPNCTPFYCKYEAGVITATAIDIKVRDFSGIPEPGVSDNLRPTSLTPEHQYNLVNQGWTSNPAWIGFSSTPTTVGTGAKAFTVAAGLPVVLGQAAVARATYATPLDVAMYGTVTAYGGTTITLNITAVSGHTGETFSTWQVEPTSPSLINTWLAAEGNYPSNADVWWRFKNSTGSFDPATTAPNVTIGSGPAPKGFFLLNPFVQQRGVASGISGLTDIITTVRPRTGTWFQGRVWYAGVDASQSASGDAPYYTWTENIYFSQTIVDSTQFGKCYQNNDPTSEDLFDLLPTDGGVIVIQGSGPIYKLFPIQNGLLVHAANGIWFITGSQGIGFASNDYTVTNISYVKCLSATSFINVLGTPMFWNAEGIYAVKPAEQGGGLVVSNLCYGTILSYYENIPLASKKFARGDYDPVGFVVRWIFRSDPETTLTSRYEFNKMLNFSTANKAFYPYSVSATPKIKDVKYITYLGEVDDPEPVFKFFTAYAGNVTFSDENDFTNWVDFKTADSIGSNYTSYFVTGYKLHGKGINKFQPTYIYVFSKSDEPTSYKFQGIWDYAGSGNSGRYSSIQLVTNGLTRFNNLYRRHKIRGRGLALQLKVQSVDGYPFKIMGWTSSETVNAGV